MQRLATLSLLALSIFGHAIARPMEFAHVEDVAKDVLSSEAARPSSLAIPPEPRLAAPEISGTTSGDQPPPALSLEDRSRVADLIKKKGRHGFLEMVEPHWLEHPVLQREVERRSRLSAMNSARRKVVRESKLAVAHRSREAQTPTQAESGASAIEQTALRGPPRHRPKTQPNLEAKRIRSAVIAEQRSRAVESALGEMLLKDRLQAPERGLTRSRPGKAALVDPKPDAALKGRQPRKRKSRYDFLPDWEHSGPNAANHHGFAIFESAEVHPPTLSSPASSVPAHSSSRSHIRSQPRPDSSSATRSRASRGMRGEIPDLNLPASGATSGGEA